MRPSIAAFLAILTTSTGAEAYSGKSWMGFYFGAQGGVGIGQSAATFSSNLGTGQRSLGQKQFAQKELELGVSASSLWTSHQVR
jgi:hypothetical protein